MKGLKKYIPYLIGLLLLLSSCSSTQTLKDKELLLAKTSIDVKGGAKIDTDEAEGYVQQKPNKTILGFLKFHLFLFNLVPDSYVQTRNNACDDRVDRRNERRRRKNIKRILKAEETNDSTGVKLKEYVDCHPSFWDNLRNTIGEPPVIYDSSEVTETKEQLSKYLNSKGYFHNKVESHVRFKPKDSKRKARLGLPQKNKRKAFVTYTLHPGEPYIIKRLSQSINDTSLLEPVKRSVNQTLILRGNNYDVSVIDEERKRMAKAMRDEGYYYFNKEYIVYQIDSAFNNNKLTIRQIIRDPLERDVTTAGKDTLISGVHHKYHISKVVVNANFDPKNQSQKMEEDVVVVDGIHFINKSLLQYYPDVIAQQIFIRPGDLYSQSKDEYTYRRLSGLNNFKFIDIDYREDETSDKHYLVCYINLTPSIKQSVALEAEGTTTGGQLGMSGSTNYKNRNTFNRAEQFNLRLKAGIEAQQTINGNQSTEEESALESFIPFNTLEYGAESSITFPKLLLFNNLFLNRLKNNNPKTPINLAWNYQQRPEYTRSALNAGFSLNFQGGGKNQTNYRLTLVQLSVIGITKSQGFENYLDELNNSFLSNTYEDHFIRSSRFVFEWTDKKPGFRDRNNTYLKFDLEIAGNSLQLQSLLEAQFQDKSLLKDSGGREYYETFGTRFAQFAKVILNAKRNITLSSRNKIVYRFYGGVGLPYGNLNVLPFDRSFFGGGANDIRAWSARRLGPGGIPYSASSEIDQLGDILLEGNIEYRFDLTQTLKSAFFIDAGNVWLIHSDDNRPNGNFDIGRFYKEIAIGAGMGFRFDFDFLIIRTDFGLKLKDPGLIEDERWIFQPKDNYKLTQNKRYNRFSPTFNLGIGYPF